MSTSTFRDYALESFSGGEFSIETSGEEIALLSLALNHPEFKTCYTFDRATARDLGTSLLRWSGGPSTCTLEPVTFGDRLVVEVIDGTVMFLLPDGQQFQCTDEETIDLAQRLIVWAGVDERAVVHSQ